MPMPRVVWVDSTSSETIPNHSGNLHQIKKMEAEPSRVLWCGYQADFRKLGPTGGILNQTTFTDVVGFPPIHVTQIAAGHDAVVVIDGLFLPLFFGGGEKERKKSTGLTRDLLV